MDQICLLSEILDKLKTLNMDRAEYNCLKAICLFTTGKFQPLFNLSKLFWWLFRKFSSYSLVLVNVECRTNSKQCSTSTDDVFSLLRFFNLNVLYIFFFFELNSFQKHSNTDLFHFFSCVLVISVLPFLSFLVVVILFF